MRISEIEKDYIKISRHEDILTRELRESNDKVND